MISVRTRIDRLLRACPALVRVPPEEDHAALCAALGVTPDWLVLGTAARGYVLLPPEVPE